ncbi:hypothetical protein Tdes44962_MAKER05980 [Teratosphaeria destructans]|uniref:Uncharacterized protein n=1 Tax=Teratosphaeria destructans TaxID=418781 RepID=A0A9W7SII3_9PEZI|nr:hypothetical protein Tdes44962_MAKER05980 [Teratosphaeria destructans]
MAVARPAHGFAAKTSAIALIFLSCSWNFEAEDGHRLQCHRSLRTFRGRQVEGDGSLPQNGRAPCALAAPRCDFASDPLRASATAAGHNVSEQRLQLIYDTEIESHDKARFLEMLVNGLDDGLRTEIAGSRSPRLECRPGTPLGLRIGFACEDDGASCLSVCLLHLGLARRIVQLWHEVLEADVVFVADDLA